jgi:hypothetical protein
MRSSGSRTARAVAECVAAAAGRENELCDREHRTANSPCRLVSRSLKSKSFYQCGIASSLEALKANRFYQCGIADYSLNLASWGSFGSMPAK